MTISPQRRRDLIEAFRGRRVLVVGDLMLDRYISGRVGRLSPEAPVPIVQVQSERSVPGGAANVARNVRALGGVPIVTGLVGHDSDGDELMDLLREGGIAVDGVQQVERVRTTVKARIVAERQQVARVDYETVAWQDEAIVRALAGCAAELAADADAIVLEDYGKGVVRQPLADAVVAAAGKAGRPVGYDPNSSVDLDLRSVRVATPNLGEAFAAAGMARASDADDGDDIAIEEAGRRLMRKWHPDLLMITLGPAGMYLRTSEGGSTRIPTHAREVFDVSGAGDTVIAATMLSLLAGASDCEAAWLANGAAGVVVGKLGAATCTGEELLARLEQDE